MYCFLHPYRKQVVCYLSTSVYFCTFICTIFRKLYIRREFCTQTGQVDVQKSSDFHSETLQNCVLDQKLTKISRCAGQRRLEKKETIYFLYIFEDEQFFCTYSHRTPNSPRRVWCAELSKPKTGEFGVWASLVCGFVSGIFDAKVPVYWETVIKNFQRIRRRASLVWKISGSFGAGRVWCVDEFGVWNQPLQNDQLGEFGVWASLVCDDCNYQINLSNNASLLWVAI